MLIPEKPTDLMSLNGRVAALNRFIFKTTDKCIPFFNQVKKGWNFKWIEECKATFQNLKDHPINTFILLKPVTSEDLYIYLAVIDKAVSAAVIREDEGTQGPIYFTKKQLSSAWLNHSVIEKLAYNPILIAKKSMYGQDWVCTNQSKWAENVWSSAARFQSNKQCGGY